MSYWRRPQAHPVRRALFQVHLWAGLVTGLYATFIGLTGAALIFRPELQARTYPQFFAQPRSGEPLADAAVVIGHLEETFPGYRFSGIDYPTDRRGTFLAYLAKGDELRTVFADPATGRIVGELPRDGWIQQLQELHSNLLIGQRGFVYNGIGAFAVLTMCVTGMIVWWPGVSRLRPAFGVRVSRGWTRMLREFHGAVGIWTIVLLLMWAISGIYFSFPLPFRSAVERVAPLSPYPTFQSGEPHDVTPPAPAALIARAQEKVPGARLARFVVPAGVRGTYAVTLADARRGETTIYFDRYTGAEVAVTDQRAQTAGDVFLTWLGRLHFGNFGGLPVKVVWCAGGLALPLLFASGVTMWWTRCIRRITTSAS